MIKLRNVSKFYYSKGVIAQGFSKLNVEFDIGEFVAITGESGSGKSTLLNVLAGLDTYEEGEMYINGRETSHYIEKNWEEYRKKYIGNIYQNFNLINSYTVYQNIDLILLLNNIPKKVRKERIMKLLKRVDMVKYKNTKVSKLSGGQKQRVAIARALAKDVPIILADEPTGSLDKKSAAGIITLLKEVSKDKLIIIVTHNYEQVENFVTRKIVMHDSKILEDQKLKPIEKKEEKVEVKIYKNINTFNKLRLGIRNTFNVLPKFILLLLVYSFIVCSLMAEYSFFKKWEYEQSKIGYNVVFHEKSDKRIILNKKDKTTFTDEEINTIRNLDNIKYVVENDLIVDYNYDFTDDKDIWFTSRISSYDNFEGNVDLGRIIENENEIILECSKDDYLLFQDPNELINRKIYLYDINTDNVDKRIEYTIVGLKYVKSDIYDAEYKMYVTNTVINRLQYNTTKRYSDVRIDFMGKYHNSSSSSSYFNLIPSDRIKESEAIIDEEFNNYCDKDNCINKQFNINIKNIYFDETYTLTIKDVYNEKTITNKLGINDFTKEDYPYKYSGSIFINTNDYNKLYNKKTYQMSVFVDNIDKLDETNEQLKSMGYKTLKIKDTLVEDFATKFIRIIKIIVTIILVVVLFFISYFVIRVILKSRNIYFSIIRMLGGNKKVCQDLLIIELLTITNISYFTFILVAELNRNKYFNINFINTINTYFKYNDYITLYIILIVMSSLICFRYSRKLFKASVMNTYREEV